MRSCGVQEMRKGMAERRRQHLVAVVTTLVVAPLVIPLVANGAGATTPLTFLVTPSQGPLGTVVSVQSVAPCVAPIGATNWHVAVTVSYQTVDDVETNQSVTGAVAVDGNWGITFTPFGAPQVESQTAQVSAVCTDDQGDRTTYVTANYVGTTSGNGYWIANRSSMSGFPNNVASFGDAPTGLADAFPTGQTLVGMAANPVTGDGYWEASAAGGVYSYGDAPFYGSAGDIHLNKPIVGMAAAPGGDGYWLIASDGGIFSFGDAQFFGSMGGNHLNQPIVGMAATPDGKGYWEVASDGGIFTFGDAKFYGSTGSMHLNKPIVGMAANSNGGYWLVAADGGIFTFGDAGFYGSTGAMTLNKPIVGMAATSDTRGYWLLGADGGVFSFGDAPFYGSGVGSNFATPDDFFAIVTTPRTIAGSEAMGRQ
jgi:hypothetical protein